MTHHLASTQTMPCSIDGSDLIVWNKANVPSATLGNAAAVCAAKARIETCPKWSYCAKSVNIAEQAPRQCAHPSISRAFFKLIEILHGVNIPTGAQAVHVAEAPGGFVQAAQWRLGVKKQTIMTLKSDDVLMPKIPQNLHDLLFFGIHDDGDVRNVDNIDSLAVHVGEGSAVIVTADGGFDVGDQHNQQEQLSLNMIVGEVYCALRCLSHNGFFVLKAFDMFTPSTARVLYLLSCVFGNVYVVKPSMSRPCSSERYVVCHAYDAVAGARVAPLLRATMLAWQEGTELWPAMLLPPEFTTKLRDINTRLATAQRNSIDLAVNGRGYTSAQQIQYARKWLVAHDLPTVR